MSDSRKFTRPAIILVVALGIYVWSRVQPKEIIPWHESYANALAESQKTGKPLFLYFTAGWCGPCQSLVKTTWASRAVADELSKYVAVKLDVDEKDNLPLVVQYHVSVTGIPLFVVLDAKGEVVRSSAGAMDANEFIAWLGGRGTAGVVN